MKQERGGAGSGVAAFVCVPEDYGIARERP